MENLDLLSTKQTAEELDVTIVRVQQLCQEGRMGFKIGNDWIIPRSHVERHKSERRKPGRPPKNAQPIAV